MLLDNLELSFQRIEDDKIFFIDINGQEIVLPKNIFSTDLDQQTKVFLSLDSQKLLTDTENKKEVLNGLLSQD